MPLQAACEQSPFLWRAQWQAEGTHMPMHCLRSNTTAATTAQVTFFFPPREESDYIYPQAYFMLKKTFLIKNTVEVKLTRSL